MSKLLHVRKFNEKGLDAVRQLLQEVRETKKAPEYLFNDLITNKAYSDEIDENIEIDLDYIFKTKIDLIDYFSSVLSDKIEEILNKYRKDKGFWTWLSIAYYNQFLKIKDGYVQIGPEYCWVYDPEQYRYSRRHFIAGTIYLNHDFESLGREGKELFFTAKPNEFGGLIDAVTYKEEFARIPAMLQVLVWLYYDGNSKKKMKIGATSQDKPGTVRELTRMSDQFAMTYDLYCLEDASKLWKLLPSQFDKFKGGAQH